MDSSPDDLEINSIGSLYHGPWDNKYWSCSRGKDRYPYPVGYHAVRTHAGTTYRMEIHEGLKGPVFTVTSYHGEASTGQTPDIAWRNFQKMTGPGVKIWRGKRLSSKVDGAELFGFRNAFVRRLLRELLANFSGIAEGSLLSPSSSTWRIDSEVLMRKDQAYPDLLPYLGKRQRTGNRTKKDKKITSGISKEAMSKRIRLDDVLNDADGDTSIRAGKLKNNGTDHIHKETMLSAVDGSFAALVDPSNLDYLSNGCGSSLNGEMSHLAETVYQNDGKSIPVATPEGLPFMQVGTTVVEENCGHLLNELLEPEISDCVTRKLVIPCEQIKDRGYDNPEAQGRHCQTDNGQCDRLSDDDLLEQRHFFDVTEDSAGETSAIIRHSDAFVPDTCDTARDDDAGAALEMAKEIPCSTKHTEAEATSRASTFCTPKVADVITTTQFINKSKSSPSDITCSMPPKACTPLDSPSRELIKDSFPEFESSGSPNLNSERIDLDLAGRELAKSMMSFLLPMAVPLLVKTYVRRRSRHRKRDVKCDPCSNSSGAHSEDIDANKDAIQGNSGTRILNKQLKQEFPMEVIEPQTMAAISSPCKEAKVQPAINSCKIEPNTENDTKSVVPDSLEDDKDLCNISLVRPFPSVYHDGDAPLDEDIEHRNDTSNTEANHLEGHKESSYFPFANDGPDRGFVQPVELEIVNSVSSDSIAQKHRNRINPSVKTLNKDHLHDDETSWNNNGDILCLHPCPVKHDSSCHQNDDWICNSEEEMLLLEGMLVGIPMGHKAELSDENFPASSNCKMFADNEVRSTQAQSYRKCDSPSRQRSSPPDQLEFDMHIVDSTVVSQIPQTGLDGKAVSTGKDSSLCSVPHAPYCTSGSFMEGNRLQLPLSSRIYDIPLSKGITCTDLSNFNGSNTCLAPKIAFTMESRQVKDRGTGALTGMSFDNAIDIHKTADLPVAVKNVTILEPTVSALAPSVYEDHSTTNKVTRDGKASKLLDPSVSCFKKNGKDVGVDLLSPIDWRKDFSDASTNKALEASSCSVNILADNESVNNIRKNIASRIYQNHVEDSSTNYTNSTKEGGGTLELVGCYMHPHPVSSIFLSSKEGNLQISVLCGISNSTERTLFMYTVPIKKQTGTSPTFLGYTSLVLPLLQGPCDENMPFESSRLHFAPDDQSLVFLNNIKAPHCRQQNIGCLCPHCKSDCRDAYAIEVAYVKFGYISLVAKLTTIEQISCSLVCGPYLIAAEESGRLHVWAKKQTWRDLEEFLLPMFDHMSPAILDLKKIPKCDSVIIGHNGTGGFGIWDISQRVLLASFSSPGNTIFQIVPIGLLRWHDQGTLASYQEQRQGSGMTNSWLSNAVGNPTATSSREDLAVWVLVSAASDLEARYNQLDQFNTSQVGWWRLAILSKNTMVLGSLLDPRASAVGAFADYGIIGTCDGLLYKWDLTSGEKLANLHPLSCGVSRIAIDAESGAVVVAGENRQLLIYVQY